MHFYFSATEFACCIFFSYLFKEYKYWKQSTNIENKVQIPPILYSSQPISRQVFFHVSNNNGYRQYMNVAFWNINLEILKVWCYCMVLSFFTLYQLQVKSTMFTHNRLLTEKRNTVKMSCMERFLNTYLECIDICMIRKTFFSILLNLH